MGEAGGSRRCRLARGRRRHRRGEAERRVGHEQHARPLGRDDVGGGGHARAQREIVVVDGEDRLVGDDAVRGLGSGSPAPVTRGSYLDWVGVHRERGELPLANSHIGLVDVHLRVPSRARSSARVKSVAPGARRPPSGRARSSARARRRRWASESTPSPDWSRRSSTRLAPGRRPLARSPRRRAARSAVASAVSSSALDGTLPPDSS